MRIRTILLTVAVALAGCAKKPAPALGPSATLDLKDGSTFAGQVTKSDPSSITIQSPTGESRTYPMTQVASVQYADQAPPPPAYSSGSTPAASPAPAISPESQAPQPVAAAPPSPVYQPSEEFRTIPAGRTLVVRNNQTIDSEAAAAGQTYSAVVAHDVADNTGAVAIPRGSGATLVIRDTREQGKVEGRSELVLDVGSVNVHGRVYRLETSDFVEKGRPGLGENSRTGKFLGGGAALGGIIGAIAGGGKGAAIGALSGVGAGAATQAATRGHAVRVPAETILSFRLDAPIRVREMK